MAGAGTVVTGTLVEGSLTVGDQVALWPSRARSQVKGIQVHEQPRTSVNAGWRVAVALAGLARSDVRRGEMIGSPRDVFPTKRLTASLRPARYEAALKERGSYHLHVGSAAIATKVRLLDTQPSGLAVLDLEVPLPLRVGDIFILRDVGRRLVVAGGRVLDPRPPRSRSAMVSGAVRMSEVLTGSPEAVADALLEVRGRETAEVLRADARGGHPSTGVEEKGIVVSSQLAAELVEQIRELTGSHRIRYPLRPGIPIAELATQLEIPPDLVARLVTMDPGLRVEGATVTSGPVLDPTADERWEAVAARFEESGVLPLSTTELGLEPELVSALVRTGHLVRIVDDWVYSPEQIDVLVGVLAPDRRAVHGGGVSRRGKDLAQTRSSAVGVGRSPRNHHQGGGPTSSDRGLSRWLVSATEASERLVGFPVFKTGEGSIRSLAGSIPVRLRHPSGEAWMLRWALSDFPDHCSAPGPLPGQRRHQRVGSIRCHRDQEPAGGLGVGEDPHRDLIDVFSFEDWPHRNQIPFAPTWVDPGIDQVSHAGEHRDFFDLEGGAHT